MPCQNGCALPPVSTGGVNINDKNLNKHFVRNDVSVEKATSEISTLDDLITQIFSGVADALFPSTAKADNCAAATEDGDKVSCGNDGRYDSADIASIIKSVTGIVGTSVFLAVMAKSSIAADKFYHNHFGDRFGMGSLLESSVTSSQTQTSPSIRLMPRLIR